jgi:hypothetical protein
MLVYRFRHFPVSAFYEQLTDRSSARPQRRGPRRFDLY